MKHSTCAFAPGNISLLFQVIPHEDPAIMGSKGVGFTINEGATVKVSFASQSHVTYNNIPIELPTVSQVIENLSDIPLSVSITSPLALGCGFGMSGASALATVYAINKLLSLGKTDLELAKVAHKAEVVSKTGLGDVVNQYFGGFFAKFVPSSRFEVETIPITPIPIYCISFGKLLTSSVLTNDTMIKKINAEAEISFGQIKKILQTGVSFGQIATIVNTFTHNAGLQTPEVSKHIQEIEAKGGHAAQILLGNALVSDIDFPGSITFRMSSKKAVLL